MAERKNKKKVIENEEEVSYGKTIIAGILIIIILIGGYISYKKIYEKDNNGNKEEKIVYTEDEKKFKKEFEDLNNKKNEDGDTYKDVTIIEDNNIKYVKLDEAVDKIQNGSGVMYIASSTHQKSRLATPILLSAMESTSLEEIYYLNIIEDGNDIRDVYEIVKKKAKKTKDASAAYYSLLKLLDSYLSNYVLINSKGDKVSTGEKRLEIPTLISFSEGKVTGFVTGTVDNHELNSDGLLRNLTKDEEKKLQEKYTELITSYLDDDCGLEPEAGC